MLTGPQPHMPGSLVVNIPTIIFEHTHSALLLL